MSCCVGLLTGAFPVGVGKNAVGAAAVGAAVGDDAAAPAVVGTVRGVGYKLVATPR